MELVHLDERSAECEAFTEGKGSCVVLQRDANVSAFEDVFSTKELKNMDGSEEEFFQALEKKFREMGLLITQRR